MGLRHFADHITTETGEEVRIEIYDSSFSGTATKLQGTGSGWASRSVQQLDVREPLSNPIQKSEVSASVWLTSSSLIDDLFTSEEGRFTLIYKKDSTEYFEGTILPDLCDYDYLENNALWQLTVKAKDISILQGDDYTLTSNRVTIIEALADILPYSKTIRTRTSWIVDGTTTANDYLRQVYLDKFALRTYARTGDESDEPITKLEALEWILKANGLVLKQESGWVLDHITAMNSPASVLEANYDTSGTFVSASNVDLTSTAKITINSPYNHNPGIKSARVKYNHRTKISGIVLPEFITISTGGGSKVYTQFIQSDGTQTISLTSTVEAEVNDASISQGDPGYANVKIQAGSYYWDGDDWTLTESEFQVELIGLNQGGDDWKFGGLVAIETDALPASADGTLTLTFLQGEYVVGGVTSVFDEIVYKRSSIEINNPIATENSTSIDYQLTQSGDQSVRVNYGSVYFGDGPTGYSRGGYSIDSSGNTFTSDDWARRGEVSFVNHAQVLLREVIDVQRKSRKRISATVKSVLSFGDIVSYDSSNYYVLGGSYDGYTGVSSVELLEINIVTGSDTFEDLPKFEESGASGSSSTTSSGGLDVGTADGRYFKQINLFSEIATGDQNTAIGNLGITATKTELNYVDGVTSNIQTQLDGKQPLDSELTTLSGMTSAQATGLVGTSGTANFNAVSIGSTTAIDSSRNAFFVAGTFTNTLRGNAGFNFYNQNQTSRRLTLNQVSGDFPRLYNIEDGTGTFFPINIGGTNSESNGTTWDANGNATQNGTLDVGGNLTAQSNLLINQNIQSDNFSLGTGSTGWTIDGGSGFGTIDSSGNYWTYTDNLTVRGTLKVYELIVKQIQAIGGSEILSIANGFASEVTVSGSVGNETVVMEDPVNSNVVSFQAGDLCVIQRFNPNSDTLVKSEYRQVLSVSGLEVQFEPTLGAPSPVDDIEEGDFIVVYGNNSDVGRSNIIYRSVEGNPIVRLQSGIQSYSDFNSPASTTQVAYGDLNGLVTGISSAEYGLAVGDMTLSGNHVLLTDTQASLKFDVFNLTAGALSIDSTGTVAPSAVTDAVTTDGNTYDLSSTTTQTSLQINPNEKGFVKFQFDYDFSFSTDFSLDLEIEVEGYNGTSWQSLTTFDYDFQKTRYDNLVETTGTSSLTLQRDLNSTTRQFWTLTSDSAGNNFTGTVTFYGDINSFDNIDQYRMKFILTKDGSAPSTATIDGVNLSTYDTQVELNSEGIFLRKADAIVNENGTEVFDSSLIT